MLAPQPVAEDYSQPTLQRLNGRGFILNSVDLQIVSKAPGWNLDSTERAANIQEAINQGAEYISIAVPYDNPTKYGEYVVSARAKGVKILHRPHWQAWEGDDDVGDITSITRSGSTATVVTSTVHNLQSGNTVSMSGADQSEYNAQFVVTVVNTTTFTCTVSGTPANGSGTMLWRLGAQGYLDNFYNFVQLHPEFFEAGDVVWVCTEPNNANDNNNYTFRDGGLSANSLNIETFNQFCIDCVKYANAAFRAAGITGVGTWGCGSSVALLDLAGQTLYGTTGSNGSAGREGGLNNSDIVNYFGGILTIDHYESNTFRDGNTYYTAYNTDLDKIHTAFPDCRIMIGEIGYHTTTVVPDGEQYGVFDRVVDALRSKSFIYGVNFWVHMGSTTASIWNNNSGTIIKGGRDATRALRKAFKTGNVAFGARITP